MNRQSISLAIAQGPDGLEAHQPANEGTALLMLLSATALPPPRQDALTQLGILPPRRLHDSAGLYQLDRDVTARIVAALEVETLAASFVSPILLGRTSSARLGLLLTEAFDRVVVLNSDCHFDRWLRLKSGLGVHGVSAQRVRLVEEHWDEVAAEYERYRATLPRDAGEAAITSDMDLYVGPASAGARVSHLGRARGGKAIASAREWTLLRSWERVLLAAIRDGVRSLLILEDQLVVDLNFPVSFAAVAGQLPPDWLVLWLAAPIEGEQPPVPMTRYSPLLCHPNGLPQQPKAVGLRAAVLPLLIDRIRRMSMPLAEGPLSEISRVFAANCFISLLPLFEMDTEQEGRS